MKKINIGLIGCGHLGVLHIKNLIELQKTNSDYNFIGIYDSNLEKSKSISDEYNLRYFDSLDLLLDSIDAVFIITPTTTHFEIAQKAISKNIHSFIEKPATESLEEAEKLLQIKPDNLVVQIGHIERFNPAILSIEKYNIEPLFIEAHRLAQFNPRGTDVSVINDLMIHDIDIILNLVKSPVKSLEANGVGVLSKNIDIANARISFENGCVANVTASRISLKKMRKMRIFQNSAYISIDFMNNTSEVFRLTKDKIKDAISIPLNLENSDFNISYEKPEPLNVNAMRYEEELFLKAIIENKKPVVTLEDGINAINVASLILDKIKSN